MLAKNKKPAGVTGDEFDALNASLDTLSDLDFVETVEETIEAVAEVEVDDLAIDDDLAALEELELADAPSEDIDDLDIDDALLNAVDADIQRSEAYADQSSDIDADTSAPAAEKAKPQKAKRAASTKTAGAARVKLPRDLNALAPTMFVLEGDPAVLTEDQAKHEMNVTMALKPTQKKIAEKFENLFLSLSANRKPSTYVVDAFVMLEKTGSVTATEIITAFKADGYDDGTARSQVGQIMNLFSAVKLATRTGQTLVLNQNSAIADRLRDVLKAA